VEGLILREYSFAHAAVRPWRYRRMDDAKRVTAITLNNHRGAGLPWSICSSGHKRIAFKCHPGSADTTLAGRSVRTAVGVGIEVRPELTLQLQGVKTAEPRLRRKDRVRGSCSKRATFSALLASNDMSAMERSRFLRAGYRVPRHFRIASMMCKPRPISTRVLTTVRQPLRRRRAAAVSLRND